MWIEGRYAEFDTTTTVFEQWSGMAGIRVFMDGGMTLHEHDKAVPWDGGLVDIRSVPIPAFP